MHRDDVVSSDNIVENSVPDVSVVKLPAQPSAEDVRKHRACGHLPFRSWCPECVMGRAKEDPHKRKEEHTDIPFFMCDYCFMGTKETPSEDVENHMQSDISNSEKLTIFCSKRT